MAQILLIIFSLIISINGNFHVGMFSFGDFVVARDFIYKPATSGPANIAQYGRSFGCNITYFRVEDRYYSAVKPIVTVARGGLGKPYLVVFIKSYSSVPIYARITVACANKVRRLPTTPIPFIPFKPQVTQKTTTAAAVTTVAPTTLATTTADRSGEGSTSTEGSSTTGGSSTTSTTTTTTEAP